MICYLYIVKIKFKNIFVLNMRKSYMFFRVNAGSVIRHSKRYPGRKIAEIFLNLKKKNRILGHRQEASLVSRRYNRGKHGLDNNRVFG